MTSEQLREMANVIRALAMDAVEAAQSGHPGMPMGMADVAAVLFSEYLKFDAGSPEWADRDRFILSAGHGSMLLYALAYLTGYKEMTLDQLKHFRHLGRHTAGHPEKDHKIGIETTTGPLGQGIANAVGFALAERILNAHFGDMLVDHYTYVIAGDGCMEEGISHEASSLAGHLQLNKLIVFFDDNGITIDGPTSLSTSDNTLKRFEALNWHVQAIDGHNYDSIKKAIAEAHLADKPSLIACKTIIAYGADKKAGASAAHGSPLGAEEIAKARENLDWEWPPFEVPEKILALWRGVGAASQPKRLSWEKDLESSPIKNEFLSRMHDKLPHKIEALFKSLLEDLATNQTDKATRQHSHTVLDAIAEHIPELIGGSADLTSSNNTKAASMHDITHDNYNGNYINYGIREHGMAACMNGLSLHGGFRPYGGTFLTFTDYCRPAIRLSALMHEPVIYVMTHDSIGLGEDGPTHQPIEHLASLRAIPNLNVFRPADAIETAECWWLALDNHTTPSILALTRQKVPNLRQEWTENMSAKGAYVIADCQGKPDVCIMATGSEVQLAIKAKEMLADVKVRVISVPCWELFDAQSDEYKAALLPEKCLKAAIEAGIRMGWDQYIGNDGVFVGMHTFGASAPAPDLFEHFKITAKELAQQIKRRLQ